MGDGASEAYRNDSKRVPSELPPTPQRPIGEALESLDYGVAKLTALMQTLELRLQPILFTEKLETLKEVEATKEQEITGCSIEVKIKTLHIKRIQPLRVRIESLLEALRI